MTNPPNLPSDHYIASLLGLTPEEYRWFKIQAYKKARIEPGTPVAGLETLIVLSLIFAAISIGLTIAASFFKPKEKKPGDINIDNPDPENITRAQKFSPRYGFDSVQEPAVIGTTIPVIYANRQEKSVSTDPARPAGTYGGVRVNIRLLWSQMLSIGGDQFLRAMFMLGEANTASIEGLAIGDNALGAYDLLDPDIMQGCARLSVYYRSTGGRITEDDYTWGRLPDTDIGNAVISGGGDVFQVISTNKDPVNTSYRPNFCYTYTPNTSTQFGLSAWLPSGVGYRVNPSISPTGSIEKKAEDNGEKFKVDWVDDYNALGSFWKGRYQFSRRGSIDGDTKLYQIGETFVYRLSATSDAKTIFVIDKDNAREADAEPPDGKTKCTDVANAIASTQGSADESLVIGQLYKFGSCLAVLVARNPVGEIFISDAENEPTGGGQSMVYTFKVVKSGYIAAANDNGPEWSGTEIKPPQWSYYNGESLENVGIPSSAIYPTVSGTSQGFKCDIADITITRSAKIFEVGIKSTVGIKVNGWCNLKDSYSYKEVNDRAGGKFINKTYDSEKSLGIQQCSSGVITSAEERYSFFRVYCRPDSNSDFIDIGISFAVLSKTSQPIHNFLRFEFNTAAVWQLRFEPIASWELRANIVSAPFVVIDYKSFNNNVVYKNVHGGCWVAYCGYTIQNGPTTFRLDRIEPGWHQGVGYTDPNYGVMTDAWGKVAEAFCYDEIQTSISQGPEHEIAYVNVITENDFTPLYDNLSLLGLNIRASQQWTQLSQVSVYVTQGRTVRRLLQNDTMGASNLFPDILRDLLLSPRFGMGESITEAQIDLDSFRRAAQWCESRRYYFDGVIAEKANLRQWAADTAGAMLLEFLQRDGKFALEPSIIFSQQTAVDIPYGPVPISGIFTAGNIVENSFSMEFLSEEDRQPIQVSVKFREERFRDNYSSPGLFPVEREIVVREASASSSVPTESFNIGDYCTNFEQAIDFSCYIIRIRRLVTHSIKFSTTPDGIDTGIRAGDYIKVALDFTYYDEFANGVILEDGTIVSTRPDLMTPGTHAATYWNGSDDDVVEGNITVNNAGMGSPAGVVFIKKNINSQIRVYKIESISLGENGVIDIEAVHHPVDANGISMIGQNWTTYTTDANWIIKTS